MKTVVLTNDLTPSDIIGSELYQQYVKLLAEDIKVHFADPETLVHVPCPGDRNGQGKDVFDRLGFTYQKSNTCKSYYVNPRPRPELLEQFYADSRAFRFWREKTLKLPDSEVYYLCGSRVNWIMECVDQYLSGPLTILDYETKYANLITHLNAERAFNKVAVFKPKLYEHINLLPNNVIVAEDRHNLIGQVDVVTAFETIERMFDPGTLFSDAARFCRQGGLLLFTTASCTGLEYQVLGEHAPNLNPINRMNLLSVEALIKHVENAGFEILEFSTPGRLDVDIVRRVLEQNQNLNIDSFWRYLFEFRTEKAWQGLQNFLQENRLSSHVRIAAKKL